ncbi:OmpA/MotB family protein [Marinobacter nauticus]
MMDPAHSRATEDESANYMMSVSDIMSALLFVFIITLMAFVLNFQQAHSELEDTLGRYTGLEDLRERMLKEIERELEARNIEVAVDYKQGVLRLDERAIRFESSKSELQGPAAENARLIAAVLNSVLPCYTALSKAKASALNCRSETLNTLESVFVEGHTDNVPMLRNGEDHNWDLSAQRAIRTYREFLVAESGLASLFNTRNQPVFSVTGYGDSRPVPGHEYEKPTSDPRNRRIDLRFIMETPDSSSPQVLQKVSAESDE